MRATHRRGVALATAALTALALTACGGDGDTADAGAGATDETVAAETTEDPSVKPEFEIPSDQQPPTELQVETLIEGDGEVAESGDTVVMKYVGKSWSTGQQFDASWDRQPPQDLFTFNLGGGQVIQGWDEGLVGMKVGERRKLVIPPSMGYGERGAGGVIAPNETLVFVVDLVEIK